ncbi:DUF4435 domain-containing protein [Cronobacter dublinensis]|uniref:DUF4435 domain-containing protein n=1 Tax=Cronobacter dublinensis TaxID=413497 RepID=UPI001376443C|nr:DUF4435 domain-containing protein [Cronobacter dublinensis]NCH59905.1 DUF4435 domain-containing protein [Cronobacter dublinensis]
MNDWLTMEYDEILNEAIMSETPILVVEGVDDISIYEGICQQLDKYFEVVAVQNFKDMSEGNRGVIDFIKALLELEYEGDLGHYILGIIDRDARYYRDEIVNNSAIFVLKWYSMESHFITRQAIKCVIEQCTRIQPKLLTSELIEMLYEKLAEALMSLYYMSLECLKKACVKDYESLASYKMSVQHLKNIGAFESIVEREKELDEFAIHVGVSNNMAGLLNVCKGKWLIGEFCRILISEIKGLKTKCLHDEVDKCQFCYSGNDELCLYGFEGSYNESQIASLIKKNEGYTQFGYLKERIANMI